MDADAVFDAIADERRQLADVLAGLDDARWETQSLCAGWSVRDVAAHLVMPLITPATAVLGAIVRNRGSFARTNVAVTDQVSRRHGHELPKLLRDNASSRFAPPLSGPQAPLTDLLIHGQDIRRPLGVPREFDPDRMTTALDFLAGRRARFFSSSRADVRWVATDLDWSGGRVGAPEVRGPAEAILLARTGRLDAVDDLDGDGVASLNRA